MNITIKKLLSFVFVLAIVGLPFVAGAQLNVKSTEMAASGLSGNDVSFYDVIVTVMNWLLIVITVLAVIGFIISGVYFITAAGTGRVEDAKHWLTYSIIGIIVALIGYIIVQLVDNLLKGNETY